MKQKISIRICSIFLSLLMVVTILPLGAIRASAADSKIENAISWAIEIANNNYYGYHYGARHGNHRCGDSWCNNEDFDCSSFVATALQKGGINVAMFSTSNMNTFIKNGFTYIAGTSNLQRGDILWRNGHVGIYLGNNQVVHAMYNYNNAKGGNGGGQYRYNTWRSGADEIRVDTLNWFGQITGAYRYSYNGSTNGSTQSPPNDTHYDANAKYGNGTYKNTCNSGVNMRSSAGVNAGNKIGCTVPKNAEINVVETNGNWGKTTYAGRTGWVCLDYFTKVSIPVPSTPSISNISSENIAVGKSITINWNAVSGADNYTVGIRSAHVSQDINVGNTTSYSYTLSNAEKYSFYVKASNVSGTSGWSASRSSTAHSPVTVSFVDWDNTPLGTQTINYGSDASAPSAPQRKGYTFQGWNGSFYNVTKDITIKATYKINTYIVNFFDRTGNTIKSEKVEFGKNATPPTNTNETGKYKFLGWNSTDYLNVYTDRQDKNINIDGIYTWYNDDLPAVCTIQSATREYDGYKVIVDIENNDSVPTSGRMVAL